MVDPFNQKGMMEVDIEVRRLDGFALGIYFHTDCFPGLFYFIAILN